MRSLASSVMRPTGGRWAKDRRPPSDDISKLCTLLDQACAKFDALGDASVWSRYDSSRAIADFIRARIPEIKARTVSKDHQKELWTIFAPTCDWDDIVRDVDLGNAVFELLDRIYSPVGHDNIG